MLAEYSDQPDKTELCVPFHEFRMMILPFTIRVFTSERDTTDITILAYI